MDIKFTSNFGCFDYTLVAQVSDETGERLAGFGLGQIAQRTPSTQAETAMVGDTWPLNKKGEPARPKGFERGSIEYSEEFATILREHLTGFFTKPNDYGVTVEGIVCEVSEKTDKVESKWAYERGLIKGKNGDETRLAKLAEKVGYDGEDLTSESVEFCRAIREHNKAVLAREMAD